MKQSNGIWRSAAGFSVLIMVLTLAGCSQHESLPSTEANRAADQHLPFEAVSDKGGIFPTGSLAPTAIPAGTPVTVHLQLSLSSATSRAGDSFEAVLDEPIIVRGQLVAPQGATVAGKVLDARASDQLQESGYMRLALTAISLNGKSFPIQTSSIFVKRGSRQRRTVTMIGGASVGGASVGGASSNGLSTDRTAAGAGVLGNGKGTLIGASTEAVAGAGYSSEAKDVGVAPDRRLTFRLARPLPL